MLVTYCPGNVEYSGFHLPEWANAGIPRIGRSVVIDGCAHLQILDDHLHSRLECHIGYTDDGLRGLPISEIDVDNKNDKEEKVEEMRASEIYHDWKNERHGGIKETREKNKRERLERVVESRQRVIRVFECENVLSSGAVSSENLRKKNLKVSDWICGEVVRIGTLNKHCNITFHFGTVLFHTIHLIVEMKTVST
ncbi:uncharacterized protein MELLADRAFT_103326 [Melampsora larici-populina 98AG31]|uniref:Uncharacterized protein n=1 Tax=Melampsora larici-populina (strain 98AG31 / pathotype 3-4-7) TaxID=747676 RepID=F4RA17_MELLP|nr:uncharacterized protein MELLADRAFT_103326 [Melampsora larici-populina 98AG31]EGG10645.1 hypothetical protein MELLADRAFT_103326 [Melampsora larici-populina 98AG31]